MITRLWTPKEGENMKKLDILFIHPNASAEIYQELSKEHSAIETPIWAGMLAQHVRSRGFGVQILDCEAERLNYKQAANIIKEINPRIACLVVYGQQPSASTQNMEGSVALVKEIKELAPDIKTLMVGAHVAALPDEVLSYKAVDFVCQNEGVYTISNLLKVEDLENSLYLEKVDGLGWKKGGFAQLNRTSPIVPHEKLAEDLPGIAWDLLPPPSKYRTSGWHSWSNGSEKTPFASLYTSLGCPFKCFPAGTKVIVSNGPNKPIQKIAVGDKLIGYDEKTGQLAETEVMRLVKNEEKSHLIRIKFENGRTLKCTEEHPFYVHGKWIEARDLQVNDEIHSMNFKEKIAFHKRLYNPAFRQEHRDRMSVVMKEAIASGAMPNNFTNKEWHKKYPSFSKNPEGKKDFTQRSSERMKVKNPMFKLETRKKVSATQKIKIANGEIVPFMMKKEYWEKLAVSPNKFEQRFFALLEQHYPGEWKFVGDGSVRFDYYSPDFINVNGKKKIIELHGCYWHKCAACHPEFKDVEYKRDQDRVKVFDKYGFKTLEVWEHEVKDEQTLLKKIGEFLYNGLKIVEIKKYGLRKPTSVYNFECYPHNNYFVGLSRASKEYVLSHNCSFCMINIINRTDASPGVASDKSAVFRYWEPDHIINEFDKLAKMGVKNIKIADELFVLRESHFMEVCKRLIERNYGFNIWAYSRVDTCKPHYLETLKKAGVNWLALGIESPNQVVRKDVVKGGYKEVKIVDLLKMISDAGIYVGANYIFGLPEDTAETMQETLDFAMNANTENCNVYSTMSYPGSPLYFMAQQSGWKLPDTYSGYSQHSYNCQNLPSKNLSAAEVLKFRDEAWMKYFTNESYLAMMEQKFGKPAVDNIRATTKIKLKRRLLGD
jgi:radical SAM superfamily enzyme YgiQ (UPF0313 family)